MPRTLVHRTFQPIRKYLPAPVSNFVRSFFTATLTPVLFSYRSGHFKSSWKMSAVSQTGAPVTWYTFPCNDFLRQRDFSGKSVLEFGGGQSSLWWARRAERVVTLEGDAQWYEKIRSKMPSNVSLHLVSSDDAERCVRDVNEKLKDHAKFDIIVIDGLYRTELIETARRKLADDGAIIVDNAEGYGFYEAFRDSGLQRIDFHGHSPGVILPHCTSVFFQDHSFLLSPRHPIALADDR